MSIFNGGPAFPRSGFELENHISRADTTPEYGMSLRDYFAAKAFQSFMQGAVLPPEFDATEQLQFVAKRAYEAADAMLAAREVTP